MKQKIKNTNSSKKFIFLDRDGVINEDNGYVYLPKDFQFKKGVIQFLIHAKKLGFELIIITNQSGIGRGLYSEEDFNILTEWMYKKLIQKGVSILDTYYCPYHPDFGLGSYKIKSYDRKPSPGMILKAANKYDINLKESFLIGDRSSDIEAGMAADVGKIFFLNSKKYNLEKELFSKCTRIDHLNDFFDFI
jgi:D-glycero-D-manno-heptose 1,7-bisphosphate phosphatase